LRNAFFVAETPEIDREHFPQVHAGSEPLCRLLTNRLKATKCSRAMGDPASVTYEATK
jgi:hypothetical protein